jgi:hypothetical protein
MDAIKLTIVIFFFLPILTFGQKKELQKFPKETIYIKYEKSLHSKKMLNHKEFGKVIYFNIKNDGVWYDFKKKTDTLCISKLKNYKTSSLDEINNKEWEYYQKRFGGVPPVKNKNGVFYTYLIEIMPNKEFVIYPVIWRNEGIID